MGTHSIHEEFKSITKLGIFNPRINCAYLKSISEIPKEIIEEVSSDVIGYSNDKNYNEVIKDDLLSMTDIMKVLSCSRYMVMKYYSKERLPLIKKNNKYYINKLDLINWIKELREKRRRQLMLQTLAFGIMIIFVIVYFTILYIKVIKH